MRKENRNEKKIERKRDGIEKRELFILFSYIGL